MNPYSRVPSSRRGWNNRGERVGIVIIVNNRRVGIIEGWTGLKK